MDMMMIRRALLAQALQATSPIPVNPYITDGLVFWLDGIYKGDDNTVWTDLIGNRSFTLTDCTFTTDGVDFNGSTSGGLWNGKIEVHYSAGTIEAVYDIDDPDTANWGAILQPDSSRANIGMIIRKKKTSAIPAGTVVIDFHNGSGSNTRRKTAAYTGTTSVSSSRGYSNGVSMSTVALSALGCNSGEWVSIGYRANDSGGQRFDGRIKCIRIYNRKLTADEVLSNQQVDNTRFNLGLNI